MGGGIRFGSGDLVGVAFRPWGWGVGLNRSRFDWGYRAVFINNAAWGRNWGNRGVYVHPYQVQRSPAGRVSGHELEQRSVRDRAVARTGRPRVEEHARGRR